MINFVPDASRVITKPLIKMFLSLSTLIRRRKTDCVDADK
jgi:hypothetical protein